MCRLCKTYSYGKRGIDMMRTTCVSCAHVMNEAPKDPIKIRKQLSLTVTSVAQGEALKSVLNRPSFSNVVEALISDEHKRHFPKGQQPQPEPEQAAA